MKLPKEESTFRKRNLNQKRKRTDAVLKKMQNWQLNFQKKMQNYGKAYRKAQELDESDVRSHPEEKVKPIWLYMVFAEKTLADHVCQHNASGDKKDEDDWMLEDINFNVGVGDS